MSKNRVSIVKVQKMMDKMHINDEICASSQSIVSGTVENQPLNRSQHLKQQQQRDRSRFFYHLRQNRKQRRLQHGPLPVCHHQQQQHVKEIKRNNQEQKREILGQHIIDSLKLGNKLITAIVGSSIARNLSVKNIDSETDEIRLRFKSGSDCSEALAWLKTTEGQMFMHNVNQIIFVLGTNDIHRVNADEAVRRIAYTVQSIRYLYPGVNIVWQMLQRRTRKTWLLPEGEPVMHEISRCNVQLSKLAAQMNFDTIQPNIPINYMYDGLHPSAQGVKMMEMTIRNYLKKNKMVYSSSFSAIPSLFQIITSPPPLMSINL
jgi:lysophospholipase L1-like esterase